MKIPTYVLDLMLIGAIGAICFIPRHGQAPTPQAPAAKPTPAPAAPTAAKPTVAQPPVAQPIVPAQPRCIDACPNCGMG